MRETLVQSLSREDPLEKELAPYSSTLAWKIPRTEEPGRLKSMGSQRVRHDWETSLSLYFSNCLLWFLHYSGSSWTLPGLGSWVWVFSHQFTAKSQILRPGFDPWVGNIPWRRKWKPTPVFLPGESHGRRSLVGYSPQGRKELDTTERLHFHFQEVWSR